MTNMENRSLGSFDKRKEQECSTASTPEGAAVAPTARTSNDSGSLISFGKRRRIRRIEKALHKPASSFFCGTCCVGGECLNPGCPGSKLRRTLLTYPGHERRIAEIAVKDYGA